MLVQSLGLALALRLANSVPKREKSFAFRVDLSSTTDAKQLSFINYYKYLSIGLSTQKKQKA